MRRIYKKPVCFSCRRSIGALSLLRNNKGQTLIEYSLLLVLIAVVVVMMVKGVGITANNTYSSVNSAVSEAVQ